VFTVSVVALGRECLNLKKNMIILVGSTIFVGIVTVLTLVHIITGRKIAKIVKHFPAPPFWPILGNLFVFWGKSPPGKIGRGLI
jgi:hypothetical protein